MISLARRAAAAATVLAALAGTLLGSPATATADGPEPVRIMPLGDSITFGVGSPSGGSYRTDLYRKLTAAGVAVDFVGSQTSGTGADPDNEGHPGWTIRQLTERIDDWLDAYRPDVVLLHNGTNDMYRGVPDPAGALAELLDRIHADRPGAQVLVAQLIGLGKVPNTSGQLVRTADYNARVARLVAERGAPFHLVDQRAVRGVDLHDRVHPNDFGYRRMAWTWYRALEPVLNPTGAAWPQDGNPNRVALAYRCVGPDFTLPASAKGCRLWYHRRPAGAVTSMVWQIPVRAGGRVAWFTAP